MTSLPALQKEARNAVTSCKTYLQKPSVFLRDVKKAAGKDAVLYLQWRSQVLKLLSKDKPAVLSLPSPVPRPAMVSSLSRAAYEAVGFTKGKLPTDLLGSLKEVGSVSGHLNGEELFNGEDGSGQTNSGDKTRRWVSTQHNTADAGRLKTELQMHPLMEPLGAWVKDNVSFASPAPGRALTLNKRNMALIWNSRPGGFQPPHVDRGANRMDAPPIMLIACGPDGYDLWIYTASHVRVTQLIEQGREALAKLGPDATDEERLRVLRDTDAEVAALMQSQLPTRIHLEFGEVIIVHPRLVHFGDKGVKGDLCTRLFLDLEVEGQPYEEGTDNATFPLKQLVPGDVLCVSEEFGKRFVFPPQAE